MSNILEEEIVLRIKKCPYFEKCSQNLCPLDLELKLRYGGKSEKCRYMREPKKAKIGEREFISGGSVMPDAPLNFVSESNLEWLNETSKARWSELKNITMQ